MTILALTLRNLVDIGGVKARLNSEKEQGIPHDNDDIEYLLRTCTDLGLVFYSGIEYYAVIYVPEIALEELDEDN